MAWKIKRISNNRERVAESTRRALEAAASNGGRGYGSIATAVEAALQAFGSVNGGHSIEVETNGDIALDGSGYATISVRTIDPDVMV